MEENGRESECKMSSKTKMSTALKSNVQIQDKPWDIPWIFFGDLSQSQSRRDANK